MSAPPSHPWKTSCPLSRSQLLRARAHADCKGVPYGTAVKDFCGVCGGDGSTCAVTKQTIIDAGNQRKPGKFLHVVTANESVPTATQILHNPQLKQAPVMTVGDPSGHTHVDMGHGGNAAFGEQVQLQSKPPGRFRSWTRFEVYGGAHLTLVSLIFQGQHIAALGEGAATSGGVVYSKNGKVIVRRCLFVDNDADKGAAAHISAAAHAAIRCPSFTAVRAAHCPRRSSPQPLSMAARCRVAARCLGPWSRDC